MTDIASQYREILTSEESIPSLDSAVRFVMHIASGNGNGNGKHWQKLLNERVSVHARVNGAGSNAKRLKDVSWVLAKLPHRIHKSLADVPDDQYSLLMDSLLVVFHHAYFVLLPELRDGERVELLDVFRRLASALPRRQDQFQALGLVEIEEGSLDTAVESFRTALAATHSDEHDFITRVQMIWNVLMERKRYAEAFDCLMEVYPRTSRGDLGEVSALLRETFEALRRHVSNPPARTRKHA